MTEQTGQLPPQAGEAQTGEQTSQAPQVEGKFAGKSAAEIATAYEELEHKLGEQGQQLGQLKSANEQMTAYLQQVAQQMQAQRPPEPEQPTKFDWDKPVESVTQVAGQAAGKELDKKLGEFYRVIRTQQAQTASGFAKMVAQGQYPHLFEGGADKEVDAFMQNALRSGTVDPAVVENPQMWASIAYIMKGFKQNFGAGEVSPVSPQYGERPTGVKARDVEGEDEPLELEPEHKKAIREVAEAAGIKEDDFIKEFKQERKKGKK